MLDDCTPSTPAVLVLNTEGTIFVDSDNNQVGLDSLRLPAESKTACSLDPEAKT